MDKAEIDLEEACEHARKARADGHRLAHQAARQIEALVEEVKQLRAENYRLREFLRVFP